MCGMHQSFHHAGGPHHDQRSHLHQDPRAQTPLPPANEEADQEEDMRSPLQNGGGEHRRGVHVHRGIAECIGPTHFNLFYSLLQMNPDPIVHL